MADRREGGINNSSIPRRGKRQGILYCPESRHRQGSRKERVGLGETSFLPFSILRIGGTPESESIKVVGQGAAPVKEEPHTNDISGGSINTLAQP